MPRNRCHCNNIINAVHFSCEWFKCSGWSVHIYWYFTEIILFNWISLLNNPFQLIVCINFDSLCRNIFCLPSKTLVCLCVCRPWLRWLTGVMLTSWWSITTVTHWGFRAELLKCPCLTSQPWGKRLLISQALKRYLNQCVVLVTVSNFHVATIAEAFTVLSRYWNLVAKKVLS